MVNWCFGALRLLLLFLILPGSFCNKCDSGHLECQDGQCIPQERVCDGHYDCSDGEDENECRHFQCTPPLWFQCGDGRCISSLLVCDGEKDCKDHSDEKENCSSESHKLSGTCSPDEFQCLNKECVFDMWTCDGEPDCSDGSDETIGCGEKLDCSDGFRCKNNHCIIKEFHCDGTDDCGDNSDEENCHSMFHSTERCFKEDGLFLCRDKIVCVEVKEVCDGFHHCFDKSDEEDCSTDRILNETFCHSYGCSHSCHQAPHREIACTCPKGFRLDADLKRCVDVDECQQFGSCYQRCKNSVGSFECYCDDGYTLQPDKRSCKAKGGEALLLFASFNQIRGIYLQSQVYFSVAKQLNRATGVSHNGKHVYWSNINLKDESIVRSNEDGSDLEVLVDSGLGLPEDLAVDYVTGNIYFTDVEKKHIGVCISSGIVCIVLHNEDIDKPRSLALYPQKGIMYWTDWGERAMIATSGMDGSNPKPVINDKIQWPNGLTLDVSNDRLYWVDAKALTIETARLDGSDRRVVLEKSVRHPFSIAVFEDMLYWSDWEGREIQQCNKFTGKNHSSIIKEKKDNIYGVHIYHPALQPRVENPCENLPCSAMCLLAPSNSYSCACPENTVLGSDKHTCRSRSKSMKFAVGIGNKLILVSPRQLGRQEATEIHLPDIQHIGCITYDSLNDYLIVSDSGSRKLFRFDLSSHLLSVLVSSGLGRIVSMSYDSYGHNLYFCDEETKSVEVLSLTTYERIPILKNFKGDVPMSIAVVPEHGVFFVAISRANGTTTLNRVSLDGTQIHTCVSGSSIVGPAISLTYDKKTENIFWSDSGAEVIEHISVDCTNNGVFETFNAVPLSVASQDGLVMWVNRGSSGVYYKTTEGDELASTKRIKLGLDKDLHASLTAITERTSRNLHSCQTYDACSHVCLVSVNNQGSCHCPPILHLSSDNKTCISHAHCSESQFKCREDDICISKVSRCDGYKDCPSGDDEKDCETDHCREDQFKCANGQCIPVTRVCDNEYDCSDRSDEINCPTYCGDDGTNFRCGSGECIPRIWRCDFMKDCQDGSDENSCGEMTCPPKMFMCESGTCIPDTWECDREIDCPDGSDEHDQCVTATCKPNDFSCKNGRCIPSAFACDGTNDCGDSSDEDRCEKFEEQKCDFEDFYCNLSGNNVCVTQKARCNGTAECPRGEDETDCSNCQLGEFQCKNLRCIYNKWLCDKENDCGDESDEDTALCSHRQSGLAKAKQCDEFQCKNGDCIPMYLVCDGGKNCDDGSDEGGNCDTACKGSPCEQKCLPTPVGGKCACREGFVLGSDGYTCKDINECEEERCSQLCTNTPGGFICNCNPDYLLKSDKLTCKASGEPAKYILTSEDEVRSVSHNLNQVELLFYEPGSQILGFDVDSRQKLIYWTSGTSNRIHVKNISSGHQDFIEDVGRPGKISFDWMTKNVYFIDHSTPNMIKVCHLNDKKCAKILTAENGYVITNIAVDPIAGYLFYTKAVSSILQRPTSQILRYSFADQNSTALASSGVSWVSGMVIDHVRQHLYWSDLYQQVIEKIHYDGKQRQIVFKTEVHRPESLTLFEDSLYWLTRGSGEIKKCRLYGDHKGRCDTYTLYIHDVKFISIMQEARQPNSRNPCAKTCDMYSLCVLSPNGTRCICDDGTVLSENKDQCDSSNLVVSPIVSPRVAEKVRPYSNQKPPLSGSSSAVIAVLMCVLAICLIFASYLYVKKRKTAPALLETMHFQNPSFGLSHLESIYHPNELTPGEHQYENPSAKLVQHPDGKFGLLTREKEDERRIIRRLDIEDCDSDSDTYDRVDMKANLIP